VLIIIEGVTQWPVDIIIDIVDEPSEPEGPVTQWGPNDPMTQLSSDPDPVVTQLTDIIEVEPNDNDPDESDRKWPSDPAQWMTQADGQTQAGPIVGQTDPDPGPLTEPVDPGKRPVDPVIIVWRLTQAQAQWPGRTANCYCWWRTQPGGRRRTVWPSDCWPSYWTVIDDRTDSDPD